MVVLRGVAPVRGDVSEIWSAVWEVVARRLGGKGSLPTRTNSGETKLKDPISIGGVELGWGLEVSGGLGPQKTWY